MQNSRDALRPGSLRFQGRRADGSEDEMDPEQVAQIEMWEKEFKGLKSLRDEKRVEEK